MEGWRDGGLEGWRDGGLEGRRAGRGWSSYATARLPPAVQSGGERSLLMERYCGNVTDVPLTGKAVCEQLTALSPNVGAILLHDV